MKELAELTIGIEEEYQLIDPNTRELTSYVSEILDQGALLFKDEVKPELLQSQIEIGSQACNNISELENELIRLRSMIKEYANKNKLEFLAAGTHPFSHWKDQIVTDRERYHGLMDSMQYVARRLLIFGMHIHIGIRDKNLQIDIMNQIRYFMPHILALSTSSPLWQKNNTGFKSFRSIVFEDLPRTGTPEAFSSYSEYKEYLNILLKSKSIDDPTKIWWDIRPHNKYPTLEFRICDCCTRMKDALAIAALIQALVAKLIKLKNSNQTWRLYRTSLINENKWRAIKNGVNAKLIDYGKQKEIKFKNLMLEMVDFVEDVIDELDSREYISHIFNIIENGTSADMQLETFKNSENIHDVVDQLIEETIKGC